MNTKIFKKTQIHYGPNPCKTDVIAVNKEGEWIDDESAIIGRVTCKACLKKNQKAKG